MANVRAVPDLHLDAEFKLKKAVKVVLQLYNGEDNLSESQRYLESESKESFRIFIVKNF